MLVRFVPSFVLSIVVLPAQEIAFDRDVRPLLSDRCYACHGPDAGARKAKLRLDTRAGLFEARENGVLVVPGSPRESLLVQRIMATGSRKMPPADSHLTLSAAEKALLTRWIERGAPWRGHWAFERPRRPAPPDGDAISPVDRFIDARLRAEGIEAAGPASKEKLLRRVTFDLTGLPPTLDEIDAFIADDAPGAYSRVLDRLLVSPAYGERMAWDWLDIARYADTNGFQHDATRSMWPWRDWVVDAFNRNMRFDRFTVWQIAGDLLPGATREQRLATAFNRNHMINGEGGRIAEENRVEYVFDQLETVGTTWMGLTFNCCRCHDHKFDPITQREYFGQFAFFNQTPVDGGGGNPATPPVIGWPDDEGVKVMVMQDRKTRRKTFRLDRGLYDQRREEVAASVPTILPPLDAPPGRPADRLALARWLVRDDHPLTARVTVNRLWQMFFGVGLVKTAGDFGVQGEKPSHPELLDWLAVEFIESGWDVKAMVRLIVSSDAYRRSAVVPGAVRERDPENRLLARGPRGRLPSWMIRDHALASSGLLVGKRGGPAVKPYQPAGVWADMSFGTIRYEQDHGEALWRRSLYVFWRRIVAPTSFFDVADRRNCEVTPRLTNTPLHALVTLNDPAFVEAARVMARRVMEVEGREARIGLAFRLATGRRPRVEERQVLSRRVDTLMRQFAADRQGAQQLVSVGEAPRAKLDVVEHATWTSLCSLVLNLDEALSR